VPVDELSLVGNELILVTRALREEQVVAEVYFVDMRQLCVRIGKCDVCLIDAFPSADTSDFIKRWSKITPNIITI